MVSDDQNIWTKSNLAYRGPSRSIRRHVVVIKYNIITGEIIPRQMQQERRKNLAKTPSKTAAEKMLKIKDK